MKMFLGSFFRQNVGKLLVLSVLILLTVLYTVPWTVRSSIENEYSGLDFHGYWYAGHFIRQGINSYAAVVNDPNPNYWDPLNPLWNYRFITWMDLWQTLTRSPRR